MRKYRGKSTTLVAQLRGQVWNVDFDDIPGAEAFRDAPERVEAWRVAARLDAGEGELRAANSWIAGVTTRRE